MKKFLLTCFVLLAATGLYAQQRTVTGKVTDAEDGSALPGVSVLIKGTSRGTATDANGNFSIEASSGDVLSLSFIGFETQEVPVGDRSTIDVAMPASIATLDEIVVIGFGEREKKDITGSVATIQSKDLEQTLFASPQFALQGKTPGVRVVNASGNPSEGPQIFVRGVGTWQGNAQPLYVIDGQIITPPSNANEDVIGNINLWTLINPNDIESMSVLKDASASAIYGSRAANGVVLITTKKGKKGKPVIEFNSQYGIQNTPTFDMLSGNGVINLAREAHTNSIDPTVILEEDLYGRNEGDVGKRLNQFAPQLDPESPFYIGENPQGYDWQEGIIQKNAVNQNHSVKMSSATDVLDYYVSVGYNQQESVIKGNDLERYNLAVNVNSKISKYIRAGINYKLTYQESDDNRRMNLEEAAVAPPWQPLFDPNNEYGAAPTRRLRNPNTGAVLGTPELLYGSQTRINPIGLMNANFNDFTLLRNLGQGYVEIEPITGLTFRGSLSLDYTYQQREGFTNVLQDQFLSTGGTGLAPTSFGSYGTRTNRFYNYQADFSVAYNRTLLDKHNISAVFAIQDQHYQNIIEDLSTRNAQTRDRDRLSVVGTAPGDVGGFSGRNAKYWYSYVGRLGYSYNNKYYLDVTGRRDASNGFPPAYRWANFYSFAAAWRLSEEAFLQPITQINDLKLRVGWGTAGNDEAAAGQFAYLSRVTSAGSYAFGSGNGDTRGNYNIGASVYDFATPDLKWETVTSTNIGIDAVLFNNRINATIDIFNRVTEDILQRTNLPLIVGTSSPLRNIGSARNRGIEIEVGYNNSIGDFTYGISGNISFIQNEVLKLFKGEPINIDRDEIDYRVEEGQPIGAIRGFQVGGVFQSQEEIDAFFANTPDERGDVRRELIAPGDLYYVDVHGDPTETEPYYSVSPDGKITDNDQTILGSTIPGHTYGLNLSAGYKGFDLSINFYGEGDVQKINTARRSMEVLSGSTLNRLASVTDRWTPTNTNTDMPRAVVGDPAQTGGDRISSRWVEDAGFFRLNNWQLGYSLPSELLQRTNVINRVRLYVGGQNNMLITRWSTLDPVNDQYPLPKSFFVGLNATF